MDKVTGLIFPQFDVVSSQDMLFCQLQCIQSGLTFVLLYVLVIFTDNTRCQFCDSTIWLPTGFVMYFGFVLHFGFSALSFWQLALSCSYHAWLCHVCHALSCFCHALALSCMWSIAINEAQWPPHLPVCN